MTLSSLNLRPHFYADILILLKNVQQTFENKTKCKIRTQILNKISFDTGKTPLFPVVSFGDTVLYTHTPPRVSRIIWMAPNSQLQRTQKWQTFLPLLKYNFIYNASPLKFIKEFFPVSVSLGKRECLEM